MSEYPLVVTAGLVLATFNARFAHCSHALRCLRAHLGPWREDSQICEFTLQDDPSVAAERILALNPRLVALSCSIWNLELTCSLCEILRAAAPHIAVIVGGPEVGIQDHPPRLRACADTLVSGEGELVLADLVQTHVEGRPLPPHVVGAPADLSRLASPVSEYGAGDLAQRLVYIESSRGCPFRCGYCTSSVAGPLRFVPRDRLLSEFDDLIGRGARTLKFLDRSVNADPAHATWLLQALAARYQPGLRVHLEMVPDRFDEALHAAIAAFPVDGLQLEIGIQSLTPVVLGACQRVMDPQIALTHLARLADSAVHLHVDLILGLPHETMSSAAASFDALWGLGLETIQLGILKRLRDTPFADGRLDGSHHFSSTPPYELLCNQHFDFATLQRLKRLARFLDLYHNSGNFRRTMPRLADGASPWAALLAFSDWLWHHFGRSHAIRLDRLYDAAFLYLTTVLNQDPQACRNDLAEDFACVPKRSSVPSCLEGARSKR